MFKEIIESKKVTSISAVLRDYFRRKAEKCKTYRKTAERFQVDDFDVIIYGNKWYIESNVYRIRIPRSVFNHIDMLLKTVDCQIIFPKMGMQHL